MTTEITVTPDRSKVLVTKRVGGSAVAQDKIDPQVRAQRLRVARAMGVSEVDVLQWSEVAKASGETHKVAVADAGPQRPAFIVRNLTDPRPLGTRHEVTAFDFVTTILPGVEVDKVAEWENYDTLCCLDIDYHDRPAPPREWLETVVYTRVLPVPLAWHFSRGGGLHLFYTNAEPFTAKELAAIAGLRFRMIDPTAGVELKKVVRGPGDEPVVNNTTQGTAAALGGIIGVDEADEDEVNNWLAEHNMEMGKRYDHTMCPIRPTPGHASKGEPVQVDEHGIFCHNCAGQGHSLGSRRAGFAPWAAVTGNGSGTDVGLMIRNLCHWGHAKYVLTYKYGLPEAFAKIAYKAACKAYHRDLDTADLVPLIDINPDLDEFTRVGTRWCSVPQSYTYLASKIDAHLSALPSCQRIVDDKIVIKKSTVAEFAADKSIEDRGFPRVEIVHGFRAGGVFLPPPKSTIVPVPHAELRAAGRAPRYVFKSRRMSEDKSWGVIEAIFPDVDRDMVRACLCAYACAQETRKGMLPVIFAHGISGAAKTTTFNLAAAIYGTSCGAPTFSKDDVRQRAYLWDAAQSGPAIVLNEWLKTAGQHKLTAREALDPILTLTADSIHHKHYHGPIKFGRVPAVFITDVRIPMYVVEDTQLARRIRCRQMEKRKEAWKDTVPAAGLTFDELFKLRLVSQEVNDACDALLSEVVDQFFAVPMTWDAMADTLGVKTLENSDDFEDFRPRMVEFFDLVCKAPEIESARLARLYANGYKQINRDSAKDLDVELAAAYSQFADNGNWFDSRQLTAADWSGLLKTDQVVHMDLKTDGTSVFVRFRVGPLKNPLAVNGSIPRGSL